MKLQKIKSGFTLIELLVVITIIGILATGWVSVFTTQLQGARDSTRVNDMKLMETAIHQYFNDNSIYPPTTTFTWAIEQYVSKDLKDPRHWDEICWKDDDDIEGWDDLVNEESCLGYYVRTNDSFGLRDSAFKIAIAFEKKVNTEKKSIISSDGWNNPTFFETFAWAGSDELNIGSWWTAAAADADMATYTWATNWSHPIY